MKCIELPHFFNVEGWFVTYIIRGRAFLLKRVMEGGGIKKWANLCYEIYELLIREVFILLELSTKIVAYYKSKWASKILSSVKWTIEKINQLLYLQK